MNLSLPDWVLVQKLNRKAGMLHEYQIDGMSAVVSDLPNWTWDLTPDDIEAIVTVKLMHRTGEVPPDERKAFEAVPGWSWDLTEAVVETK